MAIYIELPIDKTSCRLADWVEVNALLYPDGTVSKQDLLYPLKREEENPEDQIEQSDVDILASEVFSELARRSRSAGDGYPFSLDGAKIKRKKGRAGFLSYTFCLLISFFGVEKDEYCSDWRTNEVTKKFEELSAAAVESLLDNTKLGARAEVFGWPRRWQGNVLNPGFSKALEKICLECGEMKPRDRPAASTAKDAGLDVIAWKRFPDKLPGGLFFWGQCAAGMDWPSKLGSVRQFKAFVDEYTPPITGTFIPHMPDISSPRGEDEWSVYVQLYGMLFNRSRIAYLTRNWRDDWTENLCRTALKEIRLQAARDLFAP